MMRTQTFGCSFSTPCDAPGMTASCASGIASYIATVWRELGDVVVARTSRARAPTIARRSSTDMVGWVFTSSSDFCTTTEACSMPSGEC